MSELNIQRIRDINRSEILDNIKNMHHQFNFDEFYELFGFAIEEYPGINSFTKKFYNNASKTELVLNLPSEVLEELFDLDEDLAYAISVIEVYKYVLAHPEIDTLVLSNKFQVIHYIGDKVKTYKKEELVMIGIDDENIIADKKVISGDYKEIKIAKKGIMSFVKNTAVKKVVMVHNHPSGSCQPSVSDIVQTLSIIKLFYGQDVKVVEHLIISEDGNFSFRDNGLLDAINFFITCEDNPFKQFYEDMDNKLFIAIMTSQLKDFELTGEEKMIVSACFLAYKLYKNIDTRENILW